MPISIHNKKMRVEGQDGTVVEVDVSALQLSSSERAALEKLLTGGSLSALTPAEKNLIANKRALVYGADAADAYCVNFTLNYFRNIGAP